MKAQYNSKEWRRAQNAEKSIEATQRMLLGMAEVRSEKPIEFFFMVVPTMGLLWEKEYSIVLRCKGDSFLEPINEAYAQDAQKYIKPLGFFEVSK